MFGVRTPEEHIKGTRQSGYGWMGDEQVWGMTEVEGEEIKWSDS